MNADITAPPLTSGAEFANRDEALEEARRLWELLGGIGAPAVLHYTRGTEYRCVAVVLEVGPR